MKRCTFYIAVATLLITASCGHLGPESGSPSELSVLLSPDAYTKGAEFSGSALNGNTAKLFMLISQRNAAGELEIPSYFMDGTDPAAAPMIQSGSVWKAKDRDIFFPLGGRTLDVLVYGADSDENIDLTSFGTTSWVPTYEAADAASVLKFKNVNTYAAQADLMYGAVNKLGATSGTARLTLHHALSQLVFNVKFTGDDMDFIETNSGTGFKFHLDSILFLNEAGFKQYLKGPASVSAGNVLLKTAGTFTVDNTKNDLEASWSALDSQADAFAVPMAPVRTVRSTSNTTAESSPVFTSAASWDSDQIRRDKVYQVGHPLLIPEQPACSMFVIYTYGDIRYYAHVSVPQSMWESGRRYVYTLVFSKLNNAIGLNLFVSGFTVAPWDVNSNTHNTITETTLELDVDKYVRYIPDDVADNWVGSYTAIAAGTDASGALCSPRMSLLTTSLSGFYLFSDNPQIRFIRHIPGVGPESTSKDTLNIAPGTDVETLYYVVPASSSVPLFDSSRKGSVYLHKRGHEINIPYNTGILAGNSSNNSCNYYIISNESYRNDPVVLTEPVTVFSAEHLYIATKE